MTMNMSTFQRIGLPTVLFLAMLLSHLLLAPLALAKAADFYVSPKGNDTWSGELAEPNAKGTDGPFATVERARDAVRELRRDPNHLKYYVIVQFRRGNYNLDRTVVFDRQDSFEDGRTIYEAYPGETPVFHSDYEIVDWKRLKEYPSYIPQVAKGKLFYADIPEVKDGRFDFRVLYKDGKKMRRARSNTLTLKGRPDGFQPAWSDYTMCRVEGIDIRDWENIEDVEFCVTPRHRWAFNILPLEKVYVEEGIIRSKVRATYKLWNSEHVKDGAWIENAIDYLDEPGEWCLNSKQGRFYYWPEEGIPTGRIVAPKLIEYLRIEGDIDIWGKDVPVKNLTFRGFTFTRGDRSELLSDDAAMQHDWDFWDKNNALVRLRGAENCEITECRIEHTADVGIRLDLYARNNRINGNIVRHTGGTGIILSGYGPGTKDVNRHNLITNNYIHHCGEIYKTAMGIHLFQSGENQIANNTIHNIAQNGIALSCSWTKLWEADVDYREIASTVRMPEIKDFVSENQPVRDRSEIYPDDKRWDMTYAKGFKYKHTRNNVIEYNEIFQVMERLGEGNCVYIAGTGLDNVVKDNFLHSSHILNGPFAAMRCDDDTWGSSYIRNVVWNIGGYGIEAKHVNSYVNNVFYDVVQGVGITPPAFVVLGRQNYENIFTKNIFYRVPHQGVGVDHAMFYQERSGHWPGLLEDQLEVDYNCYYMKDDEDRTIELLSKQQEKGVDAHSICAEPLFIDPENLDFRLSPDSPARKLGIDSIDIRRMGVQGKYQEYIKNTMRTYIIPAGGHLKMEDRVSLRCDNPAAAIHYTLDGSEPSAESPIYTNLFSLNDDCIVRARAFLKGENDFYGAIRPFRVTKP